MTRGRRIGFVVAALAVLLPLAAVAAFMALFDPNMLKVRAADAVRRSTGRELTIAGPVGLTWSLIPTVTLDDVSLSNPPGMSRPAMAHAARVEVRFALLPLLSRQVEVRGITLAGPDVLLERDAAGQPNWVFAPAAPPPSAPTATTMSEPRMRVSVDAVRVRDGRVAWRSGTGVYTLTTPAFTAAAAGPAEPVAIAGRLVIGGRDLEVKGTAGPLGAIGAGAWPLQLALEGSGVQGSANGTLGSDGIALQALHLTMPQGDVSGDAVLGWKPRPSVVGTLTSQRLNLDALMAEAAATPPTVPPNPAPPNPAPVGPTSPPTGVPLSPARLLSDAPLPFDALRRADADLHLALAEVLWRNTAYHAVTGRLLLQDGRLRLEPLQAQVPGGAVQGLVLADAAAPAPTVAVELRAPGMDAGPLFAAFGAPELTTGRVDADVQLKGVGASVRAIAASLDGHVGLAMVDGEVDNRWLAGLFGDALRGLPVELKGRSAVRCLAVRFDAAAGQATSRALLLDASRLHLDGEGDVNLADETLDLRLHALVRLGGTAIAVPVHLAGPWRSPRPQVAINGGAGQGALVIGAAPGPDACPAQLTLARDGRAGPVPAAPSGPAEASRLPKPADLLRSLLR